MTELPQSFFARPTASVARDLLGKLLVSRAGDAWVSGRIVETEAYLGSDDPGSHAATKGMTKRNAVMYSAPGTAYVYFTYGNHHMLNLVTEGVGTAGAVLIRAIEPVDGIETVRSRRSGRPDAELVNGPGKLAAALGLTLADNGIPLGEGVLSVYDAESVPDDAVETSGRIGLSAGHDLHLRYYIRECRFVSRGRPGASLRRSDPTPKKGDA